MPEKDLAKIDAAAEVLNTAWNAASEDIYKASQEAQAGAGAQQPDAGGEQQAQGADHNVSDVEYEEVKDEKK